MRLRDVVHRYNIRYKGIKKQLEVDFIANLGSKRYYSIDVTYGLGGCIFRLCAFCFFFVKTL